MKQNYLRSLPSLMLKDEFELDIYISRRKIIEDKFRQTNSWSAVISSVVYFDEPTTQEAFIDVVEEFYHTSVKNPKHLLQLTAVSVDWSPETLINFLQLCIYTNREVKFSDSIENALKFGAKYSDILKYDLKDYGLPESWINWWGIESNKEDLIKMAIYYAFNLSEVSPDADINKVQAQIEAPDDLIYDVVTYYGAYLNAKVVHNRFLELKLKRLSISDSAEFPVQLEKGRWN